MTRSGSKPPPDPLTDAAYWALRLQSPHCSPADRAAFEAWRAEEANADAYRRVQRALASVDRHWASPELTALGERTMADTAPVRGKAFVRWRWAAAAAVVLAISALVLTLALPGDKAPQAHPTPVLAATQVFDTAVGERSTVALPDESIVTLNTDSLLRAHFNRESPSRRVTLVRGQVYFDVKADPRPFEVLAGNQRIVALGTAFDVRLDPAQGVQVTLFEGRVAVDDIESDTTPEDAPATRTNLNPGEQFTSGATAPAKATSEAIERATSWREGRLVFRNDSLKFAVNEINRYSLDKLLVDDDARLEAIRISGVFRTGSVTSFVKAVETVHPVAAHAVGPLSTQLAWRDSDLDAAHP